MQDGADGPFPSSRQASQAHEGGTKEKRSRERLGGRGERKERSQEIGKMRNRGVRRKQAGLESCSPRAAPPPPQLLEDLSVHS